MEKMRFTTATVNEFGAPEISAEDLFQHKDSVTIIDVRRPEEYTGELGHIDGSQLVTLETALTKFLSSLDQNKTYVFVCRSGARSSRATLMAREQGIERCYNMCGGMLAWNESKLPIVR